MRTITIIAVLLSTITTGLCIDLAYDYMFGTYIGMHPAFALATICITWLLSWGALKCFSDSPFFWESMEEQEELFSSKR